MWLDKSTSFKHVGSKNKELVDEFFEIVLSAFGLLIGHPQELFASVKIFQKVFIAKIT